jgi:hypothetical protein
MPWRLRAVEPPGALRVAHGELGALGVFDRAHVQTQAATRTTTTVWQSQVK